MKRLFAVVVTLALAAPVLGQQPGPARPARGPNTWIVDPGHSAAAFSVKHMMIATVRGALGPVTGTVEYDGTNASSVAADVTIDVRAIDTGNASRDTDLRAPDFFDVAKYAAMTFKSKRAEAAGAGRFRLVGDLTIRGVTKEVTLDVEGPSPAIKQGNNLRVGASATTKLNRRDFGLNYNGLIEAGAVVGDEVTVTIDIEIMKPAR